MTLQLRHLRLRAVTTDGIYGADISFGAGLNVIWADNTKGKSTCMQGMLYALGLERMLSPRREIPLPHAMTSYIETDSRERHSVIESGVSVEIENGEGQIVTVHRSVKAETDRRLISVDFGAALSQLPRQLRRRDFFVLDPGAAAREDGFHYFLEDFIGWKLPLVGRYDAGDTKLYLETVFPLFWVEQKMGWSSIPAAIPTYLRIRDVHKRAVEFLMDLDVHKLQIRRQKLDELIAANGRDWRSVLDELERLSRRTNGRVVSLPVSSTANVETIDSGYLLIADGAEWKPLLEIILNLRIRIVHLSLVQPAPIGEVSDALTAELQSLITQADKISVERITLHNAKQIKDADISSLERRVKSLAEDLQKNLDVQKLQRFSGKIVSLTPDHCPTCEQSLIDTLLSQDALTAVMPIEHNIEYIRSQLRMFEDILSREETAMKSLDQNMTDADRRLNETYARMRVVRTDLTSPNSTPSAAAIEERIRAEARINELDVLQAAFDDSVEKLKDLAKEYADLLSERDTLPKERMSPLDKQKIKMLTQLVSEQAGEFDFSTFEATEVTISDDTYRPQKEGFEIGFETSASDAIRLKWAYQLGLLELATKETTNHPNMLIFDEPRQQSSAKISFEKLLKRASKARSRKQQVIFSTSEDLVSLRQISSQIDCDEHIFPGYILQKIAEH